MTSKKPMTEIPGTYATDLRPIGRALAALSLILLTWSLTACGGTEVAAEPDVVARSELVPTFTPLPPPTATDTPLPLPTATEPYLTPTPDQFESAGKPVRLRIPAIGVDAPVEQVGVLETGEMDVPKIADNVAWYQHGPLPGQPGGSVINGHLDQANRPAVFFQLRHVIPGDEMVVQYSNGDEYVFEIVRKARYLDTQVPMGRLLGPSVDRRLSLITCDGAWDQGEANYSQRLVVEARLKES